MNPPENVLGVDVGLGGGMALLNPDGSLAAYSGIPVRDFPTGAGRAVKRKIDAQQLFGIIGTWNPSFSFVEDPGIVTKGSLAGASLHNSFGTVLAVLEICEVPVRLIRANGQKGWKQVYGLDQLKGMTDTQKKERARTVALGLMPGLEGLRKKDHGVAEAALIARYGVKYLPHAMERDHAEH